ncbi:hypothetical protein [Streptomyces sp. SPB162]|uniref:hypothetical protein n=1 Tax=Streptomyces sp. SPB162 TaxID=2940560 RepID=UPI002405C2AD|nr:hypothetical protein [Streptomyces sp. SPB162]MDF9813865.1 hypothetical protein [Streptomyces sp. SPB162]
MTNTPHSRGTTPATSETRGAGDVLVRVGAVVFFVGAVSTMATMVPLFLGSDPLPTPAYFVSMLMGAGLALALGGLLRSALAQKRAVRESRGPREGQAAAGA